MRICLLALATLLAGGALFAAQKSASPPVALTTWMDANTEALETGITDALRANQLHTAYLQARVWRRYEPQSAAAARALANVYMDLEAPAAALSAIKEALRLGPSPETARALRALKAQAHAETGEFAAAWTNARAVVRESGDSADPVVQLMRQLQWNYFGALLAAVPVSAFEERITALPDMARVRQFVDLRSDTTTKTIDAISAQLEAAEPSAEALLPLRKDLAHVVALSAYLGEFAEIDENWPPLRHRRDQARLHQHLNDLANHPGASPAYAAIRQWFFPSPLAQPPAAPSESPLPEVRNYLASFPGAWRNVATPLRAAIARADAAEDRVELESAWRELAREMDGLNETLLAKGRQLAQSISVWNRAQPGATPRTLSPADADVAARLTDTLNSALQEDVYKEAKLRLSSFGQPAMVLSDELLAALKDSGNSMEGLLSASEANRVLLRRWTLMMMNGFKEQFAAPSRLLEEKLAAGTATLADFDPVIAANLMTTALWESRLAIAEAGDDWPEMVWSATLAWRDQPDTLAAWGERQLAANEAGIKAAANLASEGNVDTAIGMLLSALARDPAQAEAWAALQQAAAKAGDERLALDVLAERWRLDPPEFVADGTALALAARHARWDLLLAMSDARILADDTDNEAHYHRLLAAAALGLAGLAGDSTPALNATVYEERARLLHAVAHGLDQLNGPRFNDEETGLASVQKSLAWSEADEATRLFLALAVQFSGEALPGQPALWTSLQAGADPTTKSHLEFIRGRVEAAAYRARLPDGPDAVLAQFLERYIAALREKTPAARAQAQALADEQNLPLILRAAAAALGAVDQPYSPLPLRAADRYHAAARTEDWSAVRAALAPGQEVMVNGPVDLSIWKDAPVLRLAAYSFNRTDVTGSASLDANQLWELRGVQALGKATWTLRSNALLVCEGTIFLDQRFEGTGSYWFEDTELRRSQIYANDLLFSESVWDNPQFFVYRRAEFVRSTGRSAYFALGSEQTRNIPSSVAAFLGCTVANDTGTFGLRSGVRLRLRDTTLFTGQAPKFGQVAEVSVSNSVLITPGAVTDLPAGLAHHRLPTNSHTYNKGQRPGSISTVEELEAALAQASPGHTLRLNPGDYRLTKTLDLPDGVALRGPHFVETNGTWARGKAVLYVDTKDAVDPLIRVKSGVAMLEGVSLEVRTSGSVTSSTGVVFQVADARQERVAVLAEGDARLRLARVDVSGWHAQATLNRAELRAEGNALMLVEDSRPRLIHLQRNARVALFLPLQGYDSFFGAHGEGEFFGALGNRGRLHLRGENLRFHGLVRAGYQIAYLDGMVDARRLVWRQRARTTLWSVLAETSPVLATDLAEAPNLDARLEVLQEFSARLGQLVRVAHPDAAEFGLALHRVLTPLLETYRPDAGPMFEVVYVRNFAFPRAAGRAHLDALPAHLKAPIQGYIKATFAAPGLPTPESRRIALEFMRAFPPGHAAHSRALQAISRGQSLADFRRIISAEEAANRARTQNQVTYEEYLRIQRVREAERNALWAQIRKENLANQRQQRQVTYNPYSGTSNAPSYRTAPSYRPSEAQQMRDYRNELNARIRAVAPPRHVPRVGAANY